MGYRPRFVLCLLLLSLPVFSLAAEPDGDIVNFAFTQTVFNKTDKNDAASAIKVWASTVLKESNLDLSVRVRVFDTIEQLLPELGTGNIQGASMGTEEFFKLDRPIESVFVGIINNKPTLQYVVLVNKDGPRSLDALKSGRVLIYAGQFMNLARAWFQGLCADELNRSKDEMQQYALQPEEKVSNAIFKVFFRQSDAAIVTDEAYQLAIELNPQLGKNLQVLRVSEPLVPTLFFFWPDWTGKSAEALDKAMQDVHKTISGKQILTIHKSSRLQKFPVDFLKPTLEFVKQHQQFLNE